MVGSGDQRDDRGGSLTRFGSCLPVAGPGNPS